MPHEQLIAELERFALQMDRRFEHDYKDEKNNGCGNWILGMRQAAAALREDAGTIAELRAKLAACEADKKLLYNAIKKHKDELYELYSKPTVPEHIPMAEVLNIELHGAIAALKEGK